MTASKTTKKGSAKKDTKYPNPRGEYLWAVPGWSEVSETTFPTAAAALADYQSNGANDSADVKICQVVETYGYTTALTKK